MTKGTARAATALGVFVVTLSSLLGAAPVTGEPGGDALGAREMKLQGFAPVSGMWTKKNGKQIAFVGIAYREEGAQGGVEATAKEIRTWGFGADGRYDRMMSLADVRRLTFVGCGEQFGKKDACADVEARDGTLYPDEAFRSDLPDGAWLYLVLRTAKGKEIAISLDKALKDSFIEFD